MSPCGLNGVCDTNNMPVCSCLHGFTPKTPAAWALRDGRDGCVRSTPLYCRNGTDGFITVRHAKVPDTERERGGREPHAGAVPPGVPPPRRRKRDDRTRGGRRGLRDDGGCSCDLLLLVLVLRHDDDMHLGLGEAVRRRGRERAVSLCATRRARPYARPGVEVAALEELVDEDAVAVGGAVAQQAREVRVAHAAQHLQLAAELAVAGACVAVAGEALHGHRCAVEDVSSYCHGHRCAVGDVSSYCHGRFMATAAPSGM
ncbi:uncharacterized protein [Miscanthus floridulus]|uniref:uncharacterized protein n=1 Tax=Miscanthus floridulus TaxID=154761 RepID=UPI00345A9B9C